MDKTVISLVLTCACWTNYALGNDAPYFDVSGKASDQNPLSVDAWLPINQSSKHHLFANFTGALSPNKHNGSLEGGGIYRHELGSVWGIGTYAYGSVNRALTEKHFFTLNPGVEILNNHWHISGNAYLPISRSHRAYGNWVWADDVGIDKYIRFSEHEQYNQLVQQTSSTGLGFDVIASYRIAALFNTEIRGGVYYFNMQTHPTGYGFQLTTPSFKGTSLSAGYLHDPIEGNSISIGVKMQLGYKGRNKDNWPNFPIQHNLPQIAEANTIPIYSGYRNQGVWTLQRDNIWFFDPNGVPFVPARNYLNCTYLNPCSNLQQETTETIGNLSNRGHFQDKPLLYLRPGSYSSPYLILYNNESLVGRSADYKKPLVDASASIYTSTIIIDGMDQLNTDNTLANLSIYNNGGLEGALALINTVNVNIDNVHIGGFNLPDVRNNFYRGIDILNSYRVTMTNSSVMVNNDFVDDNTTAYGIKITGVNDLRISNSVISSRVQGTLVNAVGLQIEGQSNIILQNNRFSQYVSGSDGIAENIQSGLGVTTNLIMRKGEYTAYAIGDNTSAGHLIVAGNSQVTIHDAIFSAVTESSGSNFGTTGFSLHEQSSLNFSNSSVNDQGYSTNEFSFATNFILYDTSRLKIEAANLVARGQSAVVAGSTNVTAGENSSATISSSRLETIMAGGPSVGEPSGAVALWSLDNGQIGLYDSQVIARSLNNQTGALTLQSQGQSSMTIKSSILNSDYTNGIDTEVGSVSIVAGNKSQIMIENSQVHSYLVGQTQKDMVLLSSIDMATIHVTSSALTADNNATLSGGVNLKTIGAKAYENSTIYINNSIFSLTGPNPTISETEGNGQIIITN